MPPLSRRRNQQMKSTGKSVCTSVVRFTLVGGTPPAARLVVRKLAYGLGALLVYVLPIEPAIAQNPLVLQRDGRVISLVPYAPNILRVTMSINRAAATGAPGYGIVGTASAEGWTHERDGEGNDVYRSPRIVVRVAPGDLSKEKLPQPMPLDALNMQLREPYFGAGGTPDLHNDGMLVTTAEGKMLLHMRSWMMAPEGGKSSEADIAEKRYRVSASFDSPSDEHYYGLGQQQKGWMDLRDHQIRCWHDYSA